MAGAGVLWANQTTGHEVPEKTSFVLGHNRDTRRPPERPTGASTRFRQIEFNRPEQSVVRHRKDAKILQFAIKADWLAKDTEYAISVSEGDGTTLSGADFTIEVPHSTINGKDGKQERNFFVTIEPDTLPDRDRKLVLELAVKNQKDGAKAPNKGAVRKLTITVKQASRNWPITTSSHTWEPTSTWSMDRRPETSSSPPTSSFPAPPTAAKASS
ncbi:MAG: hypothetical protein IPH53_12700 [Flavobacteriales bacterium]|nr:hypothetical protein [Flavobacteriales bacterium]